MQDRESRIRQKEEVKNKKRIYVKCLGRCENDAKMKICA